MEKNKNRTETTVAHCPWCHNKIGFEFKHLHETTTKTTTTLVKMYKKADEN